MKDSFLVVDDFCTDPAAVRNSAFESGFNTWRPNKGEVGSSVYEGMNFWGLHSIMIAGLVGVFGRPVLPNNMFFRLTTPSTEKAYVHSDRMWGSHTAICYLSEHKEVTGTAFFRHRATGMIEMPTFEEMKSGGILDTLKSDMVDGTDEAWEQLDFVRASFNRALIFSAPLFHSRFPKTGLGDTEQSGRVVWVCHFHLQK